MEHVFFVGLLRQLKSQYISIWKIKCISLGNSTLCVIDFETTGVVQGYKNEPWQIGLVYIKEGLIDSNSMWEQYIHIDENRPFNPHVPGRHSQIRDILKNSPNKHEVRTSGIKFQEMVL